jgi:hypothetical protein
VTDVNSPLKAVRSLARVKIARRTYYVLPLRGIAYGLASLAIVFGVLLAIDRFVFGSLERGGWTAGQQWALHNKIIEENNRRKTTTNECEPRHWLGQPLNEDRPSDPAVERPRRILVIGDSFVWGPPYITLNHLWWRQLQIELERRAYRSVEVLAVGHPGWSTRRQLECARELVPQLKPDVILWGYVTNDPDEKIVPQIFDLQDKSPFGQRIRVRLKRLLPNLMFKFEALRNDKLADQYAGPEYGFRYADWELELLQGPNFEEYRRTVAEVGNFLRRSNIPTVLITLPNWPCREYFEPRYAPILPLWQSAGVNVLNALDEFVTRYGAAPISGPEAIKWGINPADSHPGPNATHFYATQAADFLEKSWPELLGPKYTQQPHEIVINDWLPSDLNVRSIATSKEIFALDYPVITDRMPQLPRPPAALVAFRYPVPISSVFISGEDLKGARVWALFQPQQQFEGETWHELKPAREEFFNEHWVPLEFTDRAVIALRFSAEIHGPDRNLQLFAVPTEARRALLDAARSQPPTE